MAPNTLCTKIFFCLVLSPMPHMIFSLTYPIETSTGSITGTEVSYCGKKIEAFLGIPYAEPPVGHLRFKKTVPKEPWAYPLHAAYYPPACPQNIGRDLPWCDTMPNQSEDCLYLNIWVPPNTKDCSKKAVMFWIYSGSFSYGSNRLPVYDGHVLSAEGDVIVVAINYRIGILGFMSSCTDLAPGNMGLCDMIEALKWVKNNIGAFGGDAESVTIFGQSAGGIACGSLCVSPLAEGLFRRAILQSGSPACLQIDNTEGNDELAQKVACEVGCATEPNDFKEHPEEVIHCLKKKDARELVDASASLMTGIVGFFTIVGDDVMPTVPKCVLREGSFNCADIMVGNTQDELSFELAVIDEETFGLYGEKDPQVNKTFGADLITKFFEGFQSPESVVQHYFECLEDDDYDAIREQLYHSMGDYIINCPDTYFAESYADRGQNVFAYYFNHVPSVTPWAPWMGSTHFDEVAFVFGRPLDHPHDYTPEERSLSRRLIGIWTNFAKTGCPGENWPQFSRDYPYYKEFNICDRKSYLKSQKKNCDFFRPYFGFV